MSKGQNKSKRFSEIAISDMLSPNVSMHKSIIINFLSEIYSTIFKRCNRVFNSYTFQEFTNLPMLISDKIYNQITNYENSLISLSQFTNGIYSLLYDDIYKKFSITFHILDFDNNYLHRRLCDLCKVDIGVSENRGWNRTYFQRRNRLPNKQKIYAERA